MARFHFLTQYVWPDACPDGLYAEQLAVRLQENGHDVQLIGGKGSYRQTTREEPQVPLIHLDHYCGRRGNLRQTFVQYAAVMWAFENYIKRFVNADDIVVVSSCPPTSVRLANTIQRRGARAIYWLQDYYPELVRGLREYPLPARRAFRKYWDRQLARWDRVVKIGANLGGPTANATVIRNWPTIDFGATPGAPEAQTALYTGNLGYGHDVTLLVSACEELRDQGYRINIRADGPGVRVLPAWLKAQPLRSAQALKEEMLRNEVHLVAAHPKITEAIFPSKIWNSIAARRRWSAPASQRG